MKKLLLMLLMLAGNIQAMETIDLEQGSNLTRDLSKLELTNEEKEAAEFSQATTEKEFANNGLSQKDLIIDKLTNHTIRTVLHSAYQAIGFFAIFKGVEMMFLVNSATLTETDLQRGLGCFLLNLGLRI